MKKKYEIGELVYYYSKLYRVADVTEQLFSSQPTEYIVYLDDGSDFYKPAVWASIKYTLRRYNPKIHN